MQFSNIMKNSNQSFLPIFKKCRILRGRIEFFIKNFGSFLHVFLISCHYIDRIHISFDATQHIANYLFRNVEKIETSTL